MKIYEAVKPGIAKETIKATLTNGAIDVTITSKTGDVKKSHSYKYDDIKKVNLSLHEPPDWHKITITFEHGGKLKLYNKSFGEISEDGKIKPANIIQMDLFNLWLKTLHQNIVSNHPINQIKFTTGSTAKSILLSFLLIGCVFGIIMAVAIRRFGLAVTLFSGIFLVGGILSKIGTKKNYDPNNLPEIYKVLSLS
jgi:hypothetical protein